MTVEEALARFIAARAVANLRMGGELDDKTDKFSLQLGPFRVPFPNPGRLAIHDVHHVVLGVESTFWGEVEVSAYEIRSGPPTLLIWILCIGAVGLGFLARPAQTVGWLRRYRGCTNLYGEREVGPLLPLDVDVLRARLRVTPAPISAVSSAG